MKNIFKKISIIVSVFLVVASLETSAQSARRSQVRAKTTNKRTAVRQKTARRVQPAPRNNSLSSALSLIKSGRYQEAAGYLLSLSKRPDMAPQKAQVKYLLGLCLMEMNLNQVAAFQFVDVIRSNDRRWTRQAIEKLLVVTDRLGDETLLNYAVQRIDVAQVPKQHREMLFFRLGEIKQKARQYKEAVQYYNRVEPQSRFYLNALYNKGLSYAEANQTDLALRTFEDLINVRSSARVNDINKVAAEMGIARVYYQRHEWDKSIEAYASIPRDSLLWHDSMFERSWAMLRAARFRSALSNFQSLHSSYYEDAYIPETLLLRAIVYLYICKYDEMEKVVDLYERQYGPAYNKMNTFLSSRSSSDAYFQEINKVFLMKKDPESKRALALPYNVLKYVSEEGNVRRSYAYIKRVSEERKSVEENMNLRSSPLGQYSLKILNNRIKSTKDQIGDMVKAHLLNMRSDLRDLNEQASFIRYEMINGKKEAIKKKIANKDLEDEQKQLDDNQDRSFYIQNGYEYYPFKGEYWLDEIGNYHYLGKQSCE